MLPLCSDPCWPCCFLATPALPALDAGPVAPSWEWGPLGGPAKAALGRSGEKAPSALAPPGIACFVTRTPLSNLASSLLPRILARCHGLDQGHTGWTLSSSGD